MKKINLKNKLSLNKETVAKLNQSQMSQVNGGGSLNHISCSGCNTVFTCVPQTQNCPILSDNPADCVSLDCTFDPPGVTGC